MKHSKWRIKHWWWQLYEDIVGKIVINARAIFGVICLAAYPSSESLAAEGAASNYFPGAYGSILPGVAPEPGPLVQSLNLYFNGKASGAVLSGTANVSIAADAFVTMVQGVYAWDAPEIGGRFAVGGYVPYVETSLNASLTVGPFAAGFSDGNANIGDIGIIPASFYWNHGNFHFNLYEMIVMPTGEYSLSNRLNVGRNYWSFDTVLATTWLNPETGTDISAVAGIMANTTNTATDYRTGTEFHLDLMANQFLSETFAVGVHGYIYEQLEGDSGTGAILGPFKGESAGIGGGFTWIPASHGGNVVISAKWIHDVSGQNRLQGDYGTLSVAVKF
ncbi:MAG: SphA family protein [Rhizobiaceae bacterium]